jgi:hypothetical protein
MRMAGELGAEAADCAAELPDASVAPQSPQNFLPEGFSLPQLEHLIGVTSMSVCVGN